MLIKERFRNLSLINIEQRLGHVDGSPVTETIYTHVVSEDGRRIAERLGDAIWSRVLDHSGPEN